MKDHVLVILSDAVVLIPTVAWATAKNDPLTMEALKLNPSVLRSFGGTVLDVLFGDLVDVPSNMRERIQSVERVSP